MRADEVLPGCDPEPAITGPAGIDGIAGMAPDEKCQSKANNGKVEEDRKRPPVLGEGGEEGGHAAHDGEERIQGRIEPERFHDAIIRQSVSGCKLIGRERKALA
jgi:hypothetical protein